MPQRKHQEIPKYQLNTVKTVLRKNYIASNIFIRTKKLKIYNLKILLINLDKEQLNEPKEIRRKIINIRVESTLLENKTMQ